MTVKHILVVCLSLGGSVFFSGIDGLGQSEIDLERTLLTGSDPVPIELKGYSPTIRKVLTFDLEVMGWEVVPSGQGKFALVGGGGAQLNARLIDRLGSKERVLFNWTGPSPTATRREAHFLANTVVEKVFGQQGIALTRIAYKHADSNGIPEIYIADFDGFQATPITRDRSNVAAPAWMPKELKVFYTSYKMGGPDIFSHDLRSGKRDVVSQYSGLNTSVALSPDGRRMAMILSKGGSPDLYVADADGKNLKRLTRSREEEACPTWAPDGKSICFTSASGGGARLYLVDPVSGDIRRLRISGVSGVQSEADWSPDGKWIAFTAMLGSQFRICVVPATGGQAVVLSQGEDPSWAPNSRNLVFMRKRNGLKSLSILDVLTRRAKDITRISGRSSQPAWSR